MKKIVAKKSNKPKWLIFLVYVVVVLAVLYNIIYFKYFFGVVGCQCKNLSEKDMYKIPPRHCMCPKSEVTWEKLKNGTFFEKSPQIF